MFQHSTTLSQTNTKLEENESSSFRGWLELFCKVSVGDGGFYQWVDLGLKTTAHPQTRTYYPT